MTACDASASVGAVSFLTEGNLYAAGCVTPGRFYACRLADYHPDGKKIPVAKDLEADKWCGSAVASVAPRILPAFVARPNHTFSS